MLKVDREEGFRVMFFSGRIVGVVILRIDSILIN